MPRSNKSRKSRPNRSRKGRSDMIMTRRGYVQNQAVPGSWDPSVVDVRPMPVPFKARVHTFDRTYTVQTLSGANTGSTVNAFYFSLGQLPNYTEFTSLFDEYRIMEAVVTFMPFTNMSGSAATTPGIIGTAIDYDDAALPGALTDLQQYDSYQRNLACESFRRVIRPRLAVAAYSGTFASYANVYGTWLDAASPNVQHYGLKTVISSIGYATSTNIYELECTLTIQCRSLH